MVVENSERNNLIELAVSRSSNRCNNPISHRNIVFTIKELELAKIKYHLKLAKAGDFLCIGSGCIYAAMYMGKVKYLKVNFASPYGHCFRDTAYSCICAYPNRLTKNACEISEELYKKDYISAAISVENFNYYCRMCFFGANQKLHVQSHVRNVHKRVVCDRDCDFMVQDQSMLYFHKLTHKEKFKKCDNCGKQYKFNHNSCEATKRKNFRPRIPCSRCGRTYVNSNTLTNHKIMCDSLPETYYLCTYWYSKESNVPPVQQYLDLSRTDENIEIRERVLEAVKGASNKNKRKLPPRTQQLPSTSTQNIQAKKRKYDDDDSSSSSSSSSSEEETETKKSKSVASSSEEESSIGEKEPDSETSSDEDNSSKEIDPKHNTDDSSSEEEEESNSPSCKNQSEEEEESNSPSCKNQSEEEEEFKSPSCKDQSEDEEDENQVRMTGEIPEFLKKQAKVLLHPLPDTVLQELERQNQEKLEIETLPSPKENSVNIPFDFEEEIQLCVDDLLSEVVSANAEIVDLSDTEENFDNTANLDIKTTKLRCEFCEVILTKNTQTETIYEIVNHYSFHCTSKEVISEFRQKAVNLVTDAFDDIDPDVIKYINDNINMVQEQDEPIPQQQLNEPIPQQQASESVQKEPAVPQQTIEEPTVMQLKLDESPVPQQISSASQPLDDYEDVSSPESRATPSLPLEPFVMHYSPSQMRKNDDVSIASSASAGKFFFF